MAKQKSIIADDIKWNMVEELRLDWGTQGFNFLNCRNKKAIIADDISWNMAEELRLEWGTLGFNFLNCKNKKAIIADGFSVKYGGGAGIWTLGGL